MTLLLIDTRDARPGEFGVELNVSPESPIERANDMPSGTRIATVEAIGGVDGATWSIVTTWNARLVPSTSVPGGVDIVTSAAVAGQLGDKLLTIKYSEPGMPVPLELPVTVTLFAPGALPNGIDFSVSSGGFKRNNIGSGVFLTTATVTGGEGNGTWAVSGWANAVIAGTGRVVTLQTLGTFADQLGLKALTVSYTEGGTTIEETWEVNLVAVPTAMVQVTADPLNIENDSVSGTRIGQVRLDGGDGSGTWSVSGWGYVSMGDISRDENDRPTAWIKSNHLLTGLTGERNVTVKYVGEGLPVAGITLAVTAVLLEGAVTPVGGGDFDTDPDFTQHWTAYKTTNAKVTQATGTGDAAGVIIEAAPLPTDTVVPDPGGDTVKWLSGFCNGTDSGTGAISNLEDIQDWRDRDCKVVMVYQGWNSTAGTWNNRCTTLNGTTTYLQYMRDHGIVPLIDTPTCDATCGANFDAITNDTGGKGYHADIRTYAGKIKAIFGTTYPCVIHMCRECNATSNTNYWWYAGRDPSVGVKVKFINAYKKVVDILREQLNTSNYKFLLSLQKDPKVDLANIWPGDTYVDYIGVNWYDAGPIATDAASGAGSYADWKSKWDSRFLTFLKAHNKKLVVCEWGARHKENATAGGGDNKIFVQHMKKLFVDLYASGHMYAESYFRINSYFPPGQTLAQAGNGIHSICYRKSGNIVDGTPFAGPAPPNGTKGQFVGNGGVGATGLMGAEYRKQFGGAAVAPALREAPGQQAVVSSDAEHSQIVSKLPIGSDFEIEIDVTVLDNFVGTDTQECPLFYFHMKGDGTSGHPVNLNSWTAAPAGTIHRYEDHSTGYRGSFAQRDPNGDNENQFRLRRMVSGNTSDQIIGSGSPNFQPGKFPFVKDQRYRCKLRKSGETVTWSYRNMTDTAAITPPAISVTNPNLGLYGDGYFIIRCMTGRKVKFRVVSVTEVGAPVSPPPPPVGGGTGTYLPRSWNDTDPLKRITVNNQADLNTALARTTNPVGAGWTILCDAPAGTVWSGALAITKNITDPTKPLIITAAKSQDINLSGLLSFSASSANVIVDGFKRSGTGAKTTFNGTNNRAQRMDASGWSNGDAFKFDGDGCIAAWITVHNPQDWTQAEKDAWWNWYNAVPRIAGDKPGSRNRYGFTAVATARNFKMWACRAHSFPRKFDTGKAADNPKPGAVASGGISYGSCQDDALQCPADVDQMAGSVPIKQFNCQIERFLTEATHLQALTPDHMAATWDLKGSGHHMKNCTILCSGKFDIRGGSLNVIENIYLSGHGMWISGGDHILKNILLVPAAFNGVTANPGIGLVAGNGKANQSTSQASAHEPFFQRAERVLLENVRGGRVTVGVDGYNNDTTDDKNPALNNKLVKVPVYTLAGAAFQTGTDVSQAGLAVDADNPVKLTSAESGHTAEVGSPTLFTL